MDQGATTPGISIPLTQSTTIFIESILSIQMSWPSITSCYVKIIEHPNLPHCFAQEEYSSAYNLPCLGTLQLRLILEGFFTQIVSPSMREKTRVEFVTLTGPMKSRETTSMEILIMHWVGESWSGHGDSCRSLLLGHNSGLLCPPHLTPVRLVRDECGGGKVIFQHSLHP